ncbi:cytochrome P450 [Streptomyces sparsus]
MARGTEHKQPPGPRGHWLTGNTSQYEADRVGFLRRCHRQYGDVFSYDDRTVFVIDPELAHQALIRTGPDFVTELAPFDTRRDLDRATAQAADWMPVRRTTWPGLSRSASAATDGRVVETLDALTASTHGRDVDVLSMMSTFTARMIATYCFGRDSAGIPDLLSESARATQPFATASYDFPAWLPLPRHRRFARTHQRFAGTLTGIVRQRRATRAGTAPDDLLDSLLDAAPSMPDDAVAATLRSVLMGGHGVPAAALTSLVRELALRPRLTAELRDEADASGPGDVPSARLPLADAVVRETLRLHPPAWLMTRTARTATTLGEWSLRPGDDVLLVPYLIHRDPRWWQRPDEFDPARWSAGRPAPGTAYLPFGAGPRVCLGSALAMRQLTLATSRLAQRFTIESPNASSATPAFVDRLAPAGLRARFRPVRQPA